MLNNSREVEIRMKDGLPRIFITDVEEYIWLQQTPFSGTDEMVYFSSYTKISDVEAYTLVPDGKSYKKISIRKFDTIDYRAPGIFHDDSQALKFNFLGVKAGAKTYVKSTIELLEPRLITTFFVNSHVNIEKSELTVTYPQSMELGYKLVNPVDPAIRILEQKKGNKNILTFTGNALKKLKSDDNSPGFRFQAAHIFLFIKTYEQDGKRVPLLGNLDDLYRWYGELNGELKAKPGPALSRVVDSLVAGCTDETCRIRSIYYWVQDHIGYIAFEDGQGAFKPRPADTVFMRRYGDCKDMSGLLSMMLRHAGIKAYMTWIGSTDLPYKFSEYPLPSTANHMIVTVKQGNKNIFLDATMRPVPFGIPSIHTQGKEALIGIDDSRYEIAEVPVVPYDKNVIQDSVHMYIVDDQLSGKGVCYFSNYLKYDVASSLIEKKDEKSKTEFLNSYLTKGNNKFEIKHFDVAGIEQKDNDISIGYEYILPAYLMKIGNEYFVNMNLVRLKTDKTMPDNRKSPYSLRFNWMVDETIILHIPENYEVSSIPENSSFSSGLFGFKVNYTKTPGSVIMKHIYQEQFLNLMPEHFGEWNKMIEALNQSYSKSVVIKKKN